MPATLSQSLVPFSNLVLNCVVSFFARFGITKDLEDVSMLGKRRLYWVNAGYAGLTHVMLHLFKQASLRVYRSTGNIRRYNVATFVF